MSRSWIVPPSQEVRRLAIEMVEDGEMPGEVAEVLGVSERSVWRWLARWRNDPEAGLGIQPGRGRPAKLSPQQATQVLGWLDEKPTAMGFATERWTAPRVAALVQQRFGLTLHPRYLNAWLTRHGVSPQMPQRVSAGRDEALIRGWLAHQWPRIKKSAGPPGDPWFY